MPKILCFPAYLNTVLAGLILLAGIAGCTGAEQTTEAVEQEWDMPGLEELYWARIDSMRMNYTQADVDFMTDMISHHAQALIMSRLAPENDASHPVQTLAARIINAQQDEIETMQEWLRDRGQPVPEVHIDELNLMIHGIDANNDHHSHHAMGHHHDMPGMLTQEQLEELADAQGKEFDRTFLKFMIEHHLGAVIMVDDLFETDGAASDREAFDLAAGIHVEQVTEIDRMRLMLDNME